MESFFLNSEILQNELNEKPKMKVRFDLQQQCTVYA